MCLRKRETHTLCNKPGLLVGHSRGPEPCDLLPVAQSPDAAELLLEVGQRGALEEVFRLCCVLCSTKLGYTPTSYDSEAQEVEQTTSTSQWLTLTSR